MYYHASPIGGLEFLEPRISNHGIPLLYFSNKRENTLVYLCNAIEKYCIETGFTYDKPFTKWGPYGFNDDGRLRLEEYYPNATQTTYSRVPGYIYGVESIPQRGVDVNIPGVITSTSPVLVKTVEFIPDAYQEILKAEEDGLITIQRYEDASEKMLTWIEKTIKREYLVSEENPEYRHFLLGHFPESLIAK